MASPSSRQAFSRLLTLGVLFLLLLLFAVGVNLKTRSSDSSETMAYVRQPVARVLQQDASKEKRNVALNFYGLSRSLKHTHASIVASLVQPLEAAGYHVDIFVHTYDLAHLTNPRGGEDLALNTTEWKLLQPCDVSITSQEKFLDEYSSEVEICEKVGRPLEPNGWQEDKDPEGQNLINLLCQLNSLNEVSHLWRKHQETKNYKAVIYARPDVLFNCPFPVELVNNMKDDTVYLPDFHPSGGLNDRFTMSVPDVAEHIGDRLFFTLGSCGSKPVHAEQYMQRFVHFNMLRTRLILKFPFYRIRATGFVHKNDLMHMPAACDKDAVRAFVQPQHSVLLDRW